jgi:hypothetical protein
MSPFWSQCISLAILFAAVCVALSPTRIFASIPHEPVVVGLTAAADIHTGAIGGLVEFASSASNAERVVAFLAVIFSVLTVSVAALWVMKKELPWGLNYAVVLLLTGPIAAAMTGLMSFATTSKLLERYSYADALAWGYERNFVAPTVKSLKSNGLAERRFVIYIPDDGNLWDYLQRIKDHSEDKEWKCQWDKKGYTSQEQTLGVGTQDGKPISRTVLVVNTSQDKYWVDFPRTLAALTDVIEERNNECEERMWMSAWLIGRFCKKNEWSAEYVDRFKKKLIALIDNDGLDLFVCDSNQNTCASTLFGSRMDGLPCNMP